MRRFRIRVPMLSLLCLALSGPAAVAAGAAQGVTLATDGVGQDAAGNPFYATFSLCAVDPETGESGVAVTTRVPFVGRAVPWVRAGVGAVATQSWTVVEYGVRGLDLLAQGVEPQQVITQLLADDEGRERRQLGVIDMQCRTASFSGAENGVWAGGRQGHCYTVQGNILVGPEVVDAVAQHFESTAGTGMPLAERLILALEAGQAQGGDKRWGNFQSAALRVANPNEDGRGGDHISLAIDVGEHEAPVAEMKRIYYRTARRLGYREFSEVRGSDVVELKRMLHVLGLWRPQLESFPPEPDFQFEPELQRRDPQRFTALLEEYRRELRAYEDAYAVYDAEAQAAVDAFRQQHSLAFDGNPTGLVDARFVEALRREYYAHQRAAGEAPHD